MEHSNQSKPKTGKRFTARWPFFLIGISVVFLLVGGINLVRYYNSYMKESALNDRLQEIRNEIGTAKMPNTSESAENKAENHDNSVSGGAQELSPLEQSTLLKETMVMINPDYVGWLEITDTNVSYPVVLRDNDYYIDHDFEGKKNNHGAIFLDETCHEELRIWLIHGHHMKDGTMFAGLSEYKDKVYLQNHRQIMFDAGEGMECYRVYAAALIDFSSETQEAPAFHYEKLPGDDTEYMQWQMQLKRNAYWYDETVAGLDAESETGLLPEILVLSTCEYGTPLQRLIVVAVKDTEI